MRPGDFVSAPLVLVLRVVQPCCCAVGGPRRCSPGHQRPPPPPQSRRLDQRAMLEFTMMCRAFLGADLDDAITTLSVPAQQRHKTGPR